MAGEGGPDPATMLGFWKEQREQLRQSENQRATLTNYVLVLAAALTGLVAQQHFARGTWPAAAFLIGMGLFGALMCAKYRERAGYHLSQARALTAAVIAAGNLPELGEALAQARDAHAARHRWMLRVRLGWMWIGLHLVVATLGGALLIVVLA